MIGSATNLQQQIQELKDKGELYTPYRQVHVVINPASGQAQPILHILNAVFRAVDICWTISITQKRGDATRQAQTAVQRGADVVAAYGGDGTIMEVAEALAGTSIPLAILPGGTGNVFSHYFRIPPVLQSAALLLCGLPHTIRTIDLGQVGNHLFALRTAIGFTAEAGSGTSRFLKEKYGQFAYVLSALEKHHDLTTVHYSLNLDGEEVLTSGVICLVLNISDIGLGSFSLAHNVQENDGMLDLFVLTRANISAILSTALDLFEHQDPPSTILLHRQAKRITINAMPSQPTSIDGEPEGTTPITIKVHPQALHVIVPSQGENE